MTIVGDGYKMQMRRSLAACKDTDPAHYEAILPVYMEIFGENCNYQMHAYEGIRELLAFAREKGMKLAVVSNKPHAQAVKTVEYVFGTDALTRWSESGRGSRRSRIPEALWRRQRRWALLRKTVCISEIPTPIWKQEEMPGWTRWESCGDSGAGRSWRLLLRRI